MALIGEQKESKKDVNTRTAQLVQLLTEIGPDIPEIARRLGQFKESVRYRYKEKIVNRGFAVQAAVDHERFGLKRIIFVVDFAPQYKEYAAAILTAMHDLAYVNSFAKTLPDGLFVVNASVPVEHAENFSQFINLLSQKGLFSVQRVLPFDWFRTQPMRAEFHDFDTGRWDFDWSSGTSLGNTGADYMPSQRTRFDYTDLLIIKELQIDANQSLVEISEKLKIGYKKLSWHYASHVLKNHLIKSYRVNWMGTRYDYKLEKALHRKHRYLAVDLLVANISEYERMELMAKTNGVPFLWGEACGKHYFAEFAFPVDTITEAFQLLENIIAPVRERATYYVMDITNALSFTICSQLYDQGEKRWMFNNPELASRFDNLILKIKEHSG